MHPRDQLRAFWPNYFGQGADVVHVKYSIIVIRERIISLLKLEAKCARDH